MTTNTEQPVDRLLEILSTAGGAVGLGVEDFERRDDGIAIRPAGIAVEIAEPLEGERRWRIGFFYEVASLGAERSTPRRETLQVAPFDDLVGVAKLALVAAAEKMIDRAIDARA